MPDFRQILRDDGLPTTTQELQQQWQNELEAQGEPITNESDFSPFRRLVDALIVQPAKQVIDALADTVLPNQYVQTAEGAALDLKGQEVQLTRLGATHAAGLVAATRTDASATVTIEAGQVIQTPAINGINYRIATTALATLAEGQTSVLIPAQAELPGAAYNLPAGFYNIQLNPLDGVSISNPTDWLLTPGTDAETDEQFRQRIRNQFNLVGDYHTDAVYRGMLAQQFGLRTDDIYFEHNAPRGPGTANGYVLLDVGNPSQSFIDDINAFITVLGNHGHGDDLQIFAMPETQHNISVDLYPQPGITGQVLANLVANIENFIRAAFRENQVYAPTLTQPGEVFSFSRLSQELHAQFPSIQRLVWQNDDIPNGISIARLNSLTVTAHE